MKDHQKRELINAVTETACTYAGTQQLRERIAYILLPVLNGCKAPIKVEPAGQVPDPDLLAAAAVDALKAKP